MLSLTGRHRASQIYTSADLIVMFHIGILCERKHPNVLISRTQNKLRDCLKIFQPCRYKLSFIGASSQSGRM